MRAYSIGYHDVTDSSSGELAEPKALYKLSREDFRKHVSSIQQRKQEVTVRTIYKFSKWTQEIPVFLTFDDGGLGSYTYVADELERYGWRGHFFITTQWIGKRGFLNRMQIRELRNRGHVIGSHSCSHPARMSHLRWEELTREWYDSCSILGDILGEGVKVASVPDGFYSQKVGKAAEACGIEVLFTSEATSNITLMDTCMIIGRYFIQMHTPPTVSGAIVAGEIWPRWQQTALWQAKKGIKALTGKSYFTVRHYVISKLSSQKPPV